jgi:hypothetical protein
VTTWHEAQSADGPGIAAWLEQRGVTARAMREWATGVPADFYALDHVLVRNGLMALDVPEELWSTDPVAPRRRPKPFGRPKRQRCKRGHPLFGANLYMDPSGDRRCRTCRRAAKIAERERAAA